MNFQMKQLFYQEWIENKVSGDLTNVTYSNSPKATEYTTPVV